MIEQLKGADTRRLYHQIADQLRELIRTHMPEARL